jgi:RNA 2',3'-cyclic 3'-phosphodiesterase
VADQAPRLFIAVPIPSAVVESCRAVIDEVRTGPAGKIPRWVELSGLHVTLRFLGPTRPRDVDAVKDAVQAAVSGHDAFAVELAGAGAFPNAARPRALWLGIADGAEELAELVRALDAPLAALGWPREDRPFRPHLTVARTDAASHADGQAAAWALEEAAREWREAFTADRVTLFRSHLGRGPAKYQPLLEVPLSPAG